MLEGVVFKQLRFHEDGRVIAYEQPRGWTYSGDASRIRFMPSGTIQAQAEILQSPLPEPQNIDEAVTKHLKDQVIASLPTGSQSPVLIGEEKNPLSINGRQSYAVTVAYLLFAQEYQMSVTFLNLPKTQLQFRVIARKQDFETVHRLFRASLYTLEWR